MVNKKISEMTEIEKNNVQSAVAMVFNILVMIYSGCAERIIKSLFFLNGGGAVTLLAYLNRFGGNCFLKTSLISFLFGLFLSFILVSLDYLAVWWGLKQFGFKVDEFYNDKISYAKVIDFLRNKNKGVSVIVVGIISGLAAILGVISGVCGYFIF